MDEDFSQIPLIQVLKNDEDLKEYHN